jgi:ribonuclease Z
VPTAPRSARTCRRGEPAAFVRPIIHCQLVNGPFGDPALLADLMFERRALLFDLGDIQKLPPRKLLSVSHAFVSHAHMDHFVGFDRLLRILLGRDKVVGLFGPAGFIDRVEHKLRAYTWNVVRDYAANLVLEITEVASDGNLCSCRFQSREEFQREPPWQRAMVDDVLLAESALRVRCAVLDHGTPSLAFALEEEKHVNIWKNRLEQRGFAVGPWLRDLKHAIVAGAPGATPIRALRRAAHGVEAATLALGELDDLAVVVPGQKIAYVVDARFHETNAGRIERLARGADQLFIECVFLDEDAAHAARKNHLTARQAGELARRAQVQRLIPFHFSPRYAERGEALCAEAERAFRGG